MAFFNFIQIFTVVQQVSILAVWDMGCIFILAIWDRLFPLHAWNSYWQVVPIRNLS